MLAANDHREIGRRMDLFHFQEEAAGMVFWHPRGYRTLRALEALIRRHAQADGFDEVRTPQLLRQPIWEASGHWQHFRQNMFLMADDALAVSRPFGNPAAARDVIPRPAAALLGAGLGAQKRAERHLARPVSPASVHPR